MSEARRDFSDERLNAFVDNELGSEEREEILAAIAEDAELSQRLCALRASKELVRHAYSHVPAYSRKRGRRVSLWSGALAAGLALVAGVLIGWQGHRVSVSPGEPALAWMGGLFAPQPTRVLLHLDSSQAERMEEALDMAEAYLAKAGHARVELVVNNSGLDLLRQEATPHAARIAALAARHDMLAFVACGNAIARYRSAGLDVTLVPEARVERTAVEHIVDRVRQGWTYLKI
ncbi:MAG: DsrE family protein [Denitratisoma sp.]|nr:DsrE family protein [Denitratisoma sp.]